MLQNFANVSDLKGVQKCLEDKFMKIVLTQDYANKQIILAVYKSNVDKVLYPNFLSKNGETELYMENEPLFPVSTNPYNNIRFINILYLFIYIVN